MTMDELIETGIKLRETFGGEMPVRVTGVVDMDSERAMEAFFDFDVREMKVRTERNRYVELAP